MEESRCFDTPASLAKSHLEFKSCLQHAAIGVGYSRVLCVEKSRSDCNIVRDLPVIPELIGQVVIACTTVDPEAIATGGTRALTAVDLTDTAEGLN